MKALVLKKVRYGESDLIVHFVLENGQILKGFAPGARNSVRRYPHHFDVSGLYDLEIPVGQLGEQLIRLGKVELIEFALEFRNQLDLLTRWSMVLEWVAQSPLGSISFADLCELRAQLRLGNLETFHHFFWRRIHEEGIAPALLECAVCHRSLNDQDRVFSTSGFAHRSCSHGAGVSAETCRWILNQEGSGNPEPFNKRILLELDQITVPYLQLHLGQPLKAFELFQQLEVAESRVDRAQL